MSIQMGKSTPTTEDKSTSSTLDVSSSVKSFWVIAHFKDCDPGNEYEILSDMCIVGDSWETLARGVSVSVKFGNARVQGYVVVISDDLSYLQLNFASLTDEFTLEHYGDVDYFKNLHNMDRLPLTPKRHFPYVTPYKHIVKVTDTQTQTDEPSSTPTENITSYSTADYNHLLKKYRQLEDVLKSLTANITCALGGAARELRKHDRDGGDVEHTAKEEREDDYEEDEEEEVDVKVDVKVDRRDLDYKISRAAGSRSKVKKEKMEKMMLGGYKPYGDKSNLPMSPVRGGVKVQDKVMSTGDETVVLIGCNKTRIPRNVYENANWHNYSGATRKLLMSIFPRNVLATHSLTGKPSPAFRGHKDMAKKMRLDQSKIADIVETVTKKCRVSESLVRAAITTKCADENKMFKIRQERKEKENNPEVPENSTNKRPFGESNGQSSKRLKVL